MLTYNFGRTLKIRPSTYCNGIIMITISFIFDDTIADQE